MVTVKRRNHLLNNQPNLIELLLFQNKIKIILNNNQNQQI